MYCFRALGHHNISTLHFSGGLTFYDTTKLPLLKRELQVMRQYKIYTLYFGGDLRSATQPDFAYWGENFRFWGNTKIYSLYFGGDLRFATQPNFLCWGGNFRLWNNTKYTPCISVGIYVLRHNQTSSIVVGTSGFETTQNTHPVFRWRFTFCDTTKLPLLRWELRLWDNTKFTNCISVETCSATT